MLDDQIPNELPLEAEPSPLRFLLSLLVFTLMGLTLGSVIMLGMDQAFGLNIMEASNNLTLDASSRNALRAALMLNHFIGFVVAGSFAFWLHYHNKASIAARLNIWPSATTLLLASALLLVSWPLIQQIYEWNKSLPLPEWAKSTEDSLTKMIEGLMVVEHPYELIFNLLVIALIPAIGEELIFRGGLQGHLEKWFKDKHAAVWVSALVFSAIHMQFEGFFPRMLLGALLGYLFVWSRSLWLPIAVHFLNNGLQVLLIYFFPSDFDQKESQFIETMPVWAFPVLIIAFFGLGWATWKSCKKAPDSV